MLSTGGCVDTPRLRKALPKRRELADSNLCHRAPEIRTSISRGRPQTESRLSR